MDDTSLLKIEHDVRQLVGVLQNLVRRQAILCGKCEERERERERER